MQRDRRDDVDPPSTAVIPGVVGAWLAYRGVEVLRSSNDCEVIGRFGKSCVPIGVLGPGLLILSVMMFLAAITRYRRGRESTRSDRD
jgi:hypothetical protein